MSDLLPPVPFTDYQKAHRLTPSKAIFETQKPWLTIATKGVVHFQKKTPWCWGFLGLVRKWQSRMTNSKSWIVINYFCSWGFIIPCLYTPVVMMMNLSLYFSIMLQILLFLLYQTQPQLYNLWTLWMTGTINWALHIYRTKQLTQYDTSICEPLRTAWC